jgi:hypothetical protein
MGPSWIRLIVAGRLGFIQSKQTRLLGDEANASYLLLYKPAPPTGFGPCSFTGPPGSLSVARSRQAPCQNTRQAPAARRRVQLHAHAHPPVLYKLKPSQVAEIHRFSTN